MALIDPVVDDMLERAEKLEVIGPPRTLDDDMRRFVLKQFRRLEVREIAVSEWRGDPCAIDENFDSAALSAVSRTEERKIQRSIERAEDLLGALARKHPPGPKPTRSLAERRP